MGLCKCPKRKVTNQFCFEHRVNVCEHCMVQKHPKCVVQSYLQWLQDSDYNPKCELCQQDLADEACVRLICYHVYHWVCLDKYARQMPADTAPAGYTCPTCNEGIFPPDNIVSPVADQLRETLKEVNWARAGLGLPLLEDKVEKRPEFNIPTGPRPPPEGENDQGGAMRVNKGESHGPSVHIAREESSIVNFDTPTNRGGAKSTFDYSNLRTSPLLRDPDDNDENKYKRKSALEMMIRWWRTVAGPAPRRRLGKVQRYIMIAVFLFIGFLTILAIFSYLAKDRGYSDPMLEPMNNPNIHVANKR